jgi:osmotically-inducible protein OsmY
VTPGTGDAATTSRPVETSPTPRASAESAAPGFITTKIQAQYFVNADVKPWNIDVTTGHDGTVTLRGEVDEAADREEAARVAARPRG